MNVRISDEDRHLRYSEGLLTLTGGESKKSLNSRSCCSDIPQTGDEELSETAADS